jgi:cell division transport system permease protein
MKDGYMSTIDDDRSAAGYDDPVRQPAAQDLPRFENPIVPDNTISGRALVAVIAIMTFLASLTTGAVILIRAAAADWQSEVARELTVQIRDAAGRDIDADVARVAEIARGFSGIADVRTFSRRESARLLEPWLGSGLALDDLPVPRLVVLRLAYASAPDIAGLRKAIADAVPSATLDDHRNFVDRMRAMARAAMIGGFAIFVLVLLATVLSVVFATRGAMAANRSLVEVLHFIGAKNGFIAGQFQRRFLLLGLKGGAIGGGGALALFALAELGNRWLPGAAATDQFAALFGRFSLGVGGYAAVVALAVLIAVIASFTSRTTVNRTLEAIQ